MQQDCIIKGNCIEVMEAIEGSSIDLVVTSPPYNIGKGYAGYGDNLGWSAYLAFMEEALAGCCRVLVGDGRLAINIPLVLPPAYEDDCNGSKDREKHYVIEDYLGLLHRVGFNLREVILWSKSSSVGCTMVNSSTAWGSWLSASNPHLRGAIEVILVANKGSWKKESGSRISDLRREEFLEWTRSIWYILPETSGIRNSHPAPFPVELPWRLVKLYSFVGDLVLDPFIGSGTTAIACIRCRRHWIGIEISEEYVKLSRERVDIENRQLELAFNI